MKPIRNDAQPGTTGSHTFIAISRDRSQPRSILKIASRPSNFSPELSPNANELALEDASSIGQTIIISKSNPSLMGPDSDRPKPQLPDELMVPVSKSNPSLMERVGNRFNQILELVQGQQRQSRDSITSRKSLQSKKSIKRTRTTQSNSRLNGTWKSGSLRIIYYISRFIMQLKTHTMQMKHKFLTRRMIDMIHDDGADTSEVLRQKKMIRQRHQSRMMQFNVICRQSVVEIFGWIDLIPEIQPDSLFKLCWDILVVMLIILNIFYIPMEISFSFEDNNSWIFETIPSWVFIIDILLTFNTAYYNNGRICRSKREIIYNYIGGAFWMDMIVVVPFILSSFKVPYMKYTFLLRVARLKTMLHNVEEIINLPDNVQAFWDLIKSVYFIIFVSHFCACAWHYLGEVQVSIYKSEESWLLYYKIYDAHWTKKYIYSYYFSTITTVTVGYGDITPQSDSERVFVVIVTLIICGVFGYTISSIGDTFKALQEKQQYFKSRLKFINQYLKKQQLNPQLQLQVRKYFEYCFRMEAERDGEAELMMNQLTKNLKEKVQIDMFSKVLRQSKLIGQTLDDRQIERLCTLTKEKKYPPETEIFKAGDIANRLIYLKRGEIIIKTESKSSDGQSVVLRKVSSGTFICEGEFATSSIHNYSAFSDKFTKIVFFTFDDYYKVVKENGESLEKFAMLKENLMFNENFKFSGHICDICHWTHHYLVCPFTFFQPNKGRIYNNFKKEQCQPRSEFEKRHSDKKSSYTLLRNTQERVLAYIINNNLFDVQDLNEEYLEQLGFIIDDQLQPAANVSIDDLLFERKETLESCNLLSDEARYRKPQIKRFEAKRNSVVMRTQPMEQNVDTPKNTADRRNNEQAKGHIDIKRSQQQQNTFQSNSSQQQRKVMDARQRLGKTSYDSYIEKLPPIKETRQISYQPVDPKHQTMPSQQFQSQRHQSEKKSISIVPDKLATHNTVQHQTYQSRVQGSSHSQENLDDHQLQSIIEVEYINFDLDRHHIMRYYYPTFNCDVVVGKVQDYQIQILVKKEREKLMSMVKKRGSNPLNKIRHKRSQIFQ